MQFSLRISAGKHAGQEIPIRGPRFLIGCADNCHLKIHAVHVSSYHCELLIQKDGLWVRDYGHGTLVGGTRIVDRRRLNHGDQLQVGSLHFELLVQDTAAKGNERLPDEQEILDILSRPVESSAAPALELSGIVSSGLESPPVAPGAATAEPEDAVDTANAAIDTLNKLCKTKASFKAAAIARPIAAPSASPPQDERAESDYTGGPAAAVAPGVSASAPRRRVIISLPKWLFTADGRLNPNVMFALGIWVGIGLCSAAVTFLRIIGR